jgi:dihydroorotate dehydrogenase (NAD+) catalytic subunit
MDLYLKLKKYYGNEVNEKMQSVEPNISVNIGKLKLKNPVLVASGCFGYGKEYEELVDLSRLGGIILKGLTLNMQTGNPPPRIIETPAGMLNAIGLQNPGVDNFIHEILPTLSDIPTVIIANICGSSCNEYVELAKRLDDCEGIDALELNISCPNVAHGGILFGQDALLAFEVVNCVRKVTSYPLIVKLTPNVGNIVEIAKAVVDGGCDAVALINTLLGMAIDIHERKPVLGNITGGLSGPAIKPVALRMVHEVAHAIDVPIIGQGGITTPEDAIEFLLAGATAVCIGTANFINPNVSIEVINGIREYLIRYKNMEIDEIIGIV